MIVSSHKLEGPAIVMDPEDSHLSFFLQYQLFRLINLSESNILLQHVHVCFMMRS